MRSQKICAVLVIHDKPNDVQEMLGARFRDIRFVFVTKEGDLASALNEESPDAVFSVQHRNFSAAALRGTILRRSVRWFHAGGSGYDYLLPWPREDIRVTTGGGVLALFLAESVFAGLLALNRNFLLYADQKRRQEWRRHLFRPLQDQTLLIVGLGSIGNIVARLAKAFGMRVVAINRSVSSSDASIDEIYPPSALAGC